MSVKPHCHGQMGQLSLPMGRVMGEGLGKKCEFSSESLYFVKFRCWICWGPLEAVLSDLGPSDFMTAKQNDTQ